MANMNNYFLEDQDLEILKVLTDRALLQLNQLQEAGSRYDGHQYNQVSPTNLYYIYTRATLLHTYVYLRSNIIAVPTWERVPPLPMHTCTLGCILLACLFLFSLL